MAPALAPPDPAEPIGACCAPVAVAAPEVRPTVADGVLAETLDALTDAPAPPTVSEGAFAESVAVLVETGRGSTPTVGVLNVTLGAGGGAGACTVTVGVVAGGEGFTVIVGVATGSDGASSASGNDRADEV